MTDDLELILEDASDSMKKAIAHLEAELVKIRAGRANPQILDSVSVEYYGLPVPLNQVATISVADARTLTIQPWEKKMAQPIERAIINSNLGFSPVNTGDVIRVIFPPLTEERRKEYVKMVQHEGENSRISIRSIRREAIEEIKKLQKNGLSEDIAKDAEKDIQVLTDKYITFIEKHLTTKEKEIMAV